jgi:uncharacterized phage-associated protein
MQDDLDETTNQVEDTLNDSRAEGSFNALAHIEGVLRENPQKALSMLEDLPKGQFQQETPESDYSLLAAFHRLRSRCLLNLGRFEEADRGIASALGFARKADDKKELAWAKYTHGLILQHMGDRTEARAEFTESRQVFAELGDYDSQLSPWNGLIALRYYDGDLRGAREELQSYTRFCISLGLTDDVRRSTINLARVLFSEGAFHQASAELSSIDETASEDSPIPERIRKLQDMIQGMIEVLRLKTSRAEELLERAKTYFGESGDTRNQVVCEEYLGLNTFLSGRHKEAGKMYKLILDRPGITAYARAQVCRLLTDVYVAEGEFDKAIETAHQAKDAIEKANEIIELGALYRSYAQAYAGTGDKLAALRYFEDSNNLLARIGAEFELGLTYLARGRSDVYDPDHRLVFFDKARDMFTALELQEWVEDVENRIRSLSGYMPYDPIAIANSFLEIARGDKENINSMKLLMLVYYTHGWALARYNKPLINEEVQAMEFGPIIPSIYNEFARFGLHPIKGYGAVYDGKNLVQARVNHDDRATIGLLREVWEAYGGFTDVQLSNMSHADDGPWAKAWKENTAGLRSVSIRNDDVREFFVGLTSRQSDEYAKANRQSSIRK